MRRATPHSIRVLTVFCGICVVMLFTSCGDPSKITGVGKTTITPPIPYTVSFDSIQVECEDIDEQGKFYVLSNIATPNDSSSHAKIIIDTSYLVPRLTMQTQWVARYSIGGQQRSGLTRFIMKLDSLPIDGERPYDFAANTFAFIFNVPIRKQGQPSPVIVQDTVVLSNNSNSYCTMIQYKATSAHVIRLRFEAGGRAELFSYDNKRYTSRIRGEMVIRY